MRYDEYLYKLALELGCGLRLEPNLAGMMYVEFGYVEGPHPYTSDQYTSQQAFAVGLHELGHFECGHTQGRPPMGHLRHYFDNGVLRSEAEAWEFALFHFSKLGETIAPETGKFMSDRCLGSYYAGAIHSGRRPTRLGNGNRHHVEFVYDEPSQIFNSTMDRLRALSAAA